MTELGYLATTDAAYEQRFTARVTARPPGAVVLDRTLFYPTGGGQPCDRGVLMNAAGGVLPVVEVLKSGTSVLHRVTRGSPTASSFSVGPEVTGAIDWERRYRHMRLHSAQHLLSALAFREFGLRTRRATMAGVAGVVDLERSVGATASLVRVEDEMARLVREDRPIRVRFQPRSEWEANPSARSGLVSLPIHVDPVRVIEIDSIDVCPCGGTHLRGTGEIGPVAIGRPIEVAGGSRLLFTLSASPSTTRPA